MRIRVKLGHKEPADQENKLNQRLGEAPLANRAPRVQRRVQAAVAAEPKVQFSRTKKLRWLDGSAWPLHPTPSSLCQDRLINLSSRPAALFGGRHLRRVRTPVRPPYPAGQGTSSASWPSPAGRRMRMQPCWRNPPPRTPWRWHCPWRADPLRARSAPVAAMP